jgi:hypothetical protein
MDPRGRPAPQTTLALALALVLVTSAALAGTMGCRSVSRFSTKSDHYEGDVAKGSFVRSGLGEAVRMCVLLDAEHLQDAPGHLTTSDGRFRATTLRPIPQIWHDPLSTLSFGEARVQNLVYVASPIATPAAPDTQDVMVVLSLMDEGGIEVRLVRGAPQADAGVPMPAQAPPMFGIFTLDRREGACSF